MNKSRIVSLSIGFVYSVLVLAILGLLVFSLGEDPVYVLEVLAWGAWGTPVSIGYSLFYATPLIFTGLSVAFALKSGLFNIGAEGQLTMGGLAMVWLGVFCADQNMNPPSMIAIPLALMFGVLGGGLWGGLVGWMKERANTHEVLGSLLLNFVSFGLAGFLILGPLKNPTTPSPETRMVAESFQIEPFTWLGEASPLNLFFVIALFAAVLVSGYFQKTVWGFRARWVGEAPGSLVRSGVDPSSERMRAMIIAGALAGLAGGSLILGWMYKVREGFAMGAGFTGIAVALLGRGNPLGIVLAAVLVGSIQKGSLELDIDTDGVSRDFAMVIQAVLVIAVVVYSAVKNRVQRWLQ